jgi:geranylgeranyl pyrophosphate synthase
MTISSVAGLSPQMTTERSVTDLLGWARELFEPEARRWVDRLGPKSRQVAGYQLGWWDPSGTPQNVGGQALRPALVLLCSRAVGGTAEDAVPDRLTAFGEHLGRAAALAEQAGGRDWAQQRASWHLRSALGQLRQQSAHTDDHAAHTASAELAALARFAVSRASRGPGA